jgi:hypothetical protein
MTKFKSMLDQKEVTPAGVNKVVLECLFGQR